MHIPVFDTVMNHLHEMSGSSPSDPLAARRTVVQLRSDTLQDILYDRPCFGGTARHNGRPVKCAFFTARDT